VSDPLRWWPGKYAECKRIAHLVEEFLPTGDVLECGGLGIFADLLPNHTVTTARISGGDDLCRLRWDEDSFDVGVSARVLELVPPRLRPDYLRELLRVVRYRVYVALPLHPELEAIDKIKNAYVWDTGRVWPHAAPRPDEIESSVEGLALDVTFHVEPPQGSAIATSSQSEWLESLLASPALRNSESVRGLPAPPFVVAEIVKAEMASLALAVPSRAAH
jgi:hypothetical protein